MGMVFPHRWCGRSLLDDRPLWYRGLHVPNPPNDSLEHAQSVLEFCTILSADHKALIHWSRYDVLNDQSERHPIIDNTVTKAEMVARLLDLNSARFEPNRGVPDPAACVAADKYGGVAGPWL